MMMTNEDVATEDKRQAGRPDVLLDQKTPGGQKLEQHIEKKQPPPFKPSWRVHVIVVGLGVANFLAALENTVVAVAAPVILSDLQLGENYTWITNAFFVCSLATQPLFGQFCNIFGRRNVMLTVIAIFMLGSGICGGATTGAMLVAGRTVQGVGSGGIVLGSSIIISDLVPLRERGKSSAMLMSIFGTGSAFGPIIGGIIVNKESTKMWRWVFYLNLPIGGAALAMLAVFLRVTYNKEMSLWSKLRRIDLVGNCILVASTVAILYALSYAGTRYPWPSWHMLVPLLLGFSGLFIFAYVQKTGLAVEPLMPPHFFQDWTSVILAINTFIYAALLYWCIFFLPVYFQAVKLYSPPRAGVAMLPISLVGIPWSVLGALALTRWGRYKATHVIAFALQALGLGLFILQDETTTIAEWVIWQCIIFLGLGIIFSTMLPAFQAFIAERDLAACTAAWYFVRLFGHVWGVAIPAAIFNNRVDGLLRSGAVSDVRIAAALAGGGVYEAASATFVEQFPPALQAEIRAIFRQALQRIWQIALVFAVVALLLSLLEKEVALRRTHETEFGLEEARNKDINKDRNNNSSSGGRVSG